MNDDNEQKRQFEELKEAIKHVTELLPPEYAKISLRLFAEDLLGTVIKIPKDLPFEETIQKIMKLILSESNSTDESTGKQNLPEALPKVRGVRIKNHIIPNARVAKIIFGNDPDYKPEDLIRLVTPDNSENDSLDLGDSKEKTMCKISTGKKIFALATLNLDEVPEPLRKFISDPFVKAVHDSVVSLMLAGNNFISLQQIAAAITGYGQKRKADDKFLKQIFLAMKVLCGWVEIDATNEAKAYKDLKDFEFEGMLIPYDSYKFTLINGQRVKAYHIFRESALYEYARQKNEIINVFAFMLELPDGVNLTRENIILQRYLLERIELARNPKNHMSNVIKFEAIYELLGAQESSRDDKKRIRNTVKAFLNNWVDLKLIAGYNLILEGRLIYGINISFDFDKPKELKG